MSETKKWVGLDISPKYVEELEATIAELREFIDDILTFGQHPRPLDKVQAHMDKIEKWQAALLEKNDE